MHAMDLSYRLSLPADLATPETIMAVARRCEEIGVASLFAAEAGHDPYIALPLVAAATKKLRIGTGIAVAYGRSPFATAQVAWDLQRLSGGRFELGLATQVKAHIERRYSTPWPGGTGALRDYVNTCRAVWRAFQTGEKPAHEGPHYRFTLLNPEFNPGPLPAAHADIPVWLAAVGTLSAELAGELAEGLHVHAFHTESYMREVMLPAVAKGRAKAGRQPGILAGCPVFSGIVHDEREERAVRQAMRRHIAFYASTPAYLPVLDHVGAGAIHEPLRLMSRQGKWDDMPALVDDTLLDKFVVVDGARRLGERLAAKYDGILTELSIYREGQQFARAADWPELLAGLKNPRR
jgi:probable F420-dependent oxidoreductase